MVTTVTSMAASADPRTVASSTHRPAAEPVRREPGLPRGRAAGGLTSPSYQVRRPPAGAPGYRRSVLLALYGRRIVRPRGLFFLGHHPLLVILLVAVVVAVIVWQQRQR